MMGWSDIVTLIIEDFVRPALVFIIPTLLLIIKSYADRITSSVVKRNEAETVSAQTTSQKNIRLEIESIVESAVCTSMDFAEELKQSSSDGKLSQQKIDMIHNSVLGSVYKSISPMLTPEVLEMLGGETALRTFIDGLIEKYVTDQKTRRNDSRMR